MNKIIYGLVFFSLFFAAIDLYFWQSFKDNFLFSAKESSTLKWIYFGFSIISIALFAYLMMNYQNPNSPKNFIVIRAFLLSLFIAKSVALIPLFLDDVLRMLKWAFRFIENLTTSKESTNLPTISRLAFLKNLSLGIGGLIFSLMSWGIIFGRFNFKKHRVNVHLKKFPKNLNGLKIIQLSDLHLGSFTSTKPIEEVVNLINQENADLIVFTGDLVNNHYWESNDFIPHLKKLKAKYGKYSVLGNHDYADYLGLDKNTDEGYREWENNLNQMILTHKKMNFDLLLNENKQIEINGSSFNLIGMENWGVGGFSKYGDFNKAILGLDHNKCSILLSHDPSHWENQVLKHPFPIELQLSGHTHGMQFGVELGNFKWSPIKFKYPQWAGLYTHSSDQNIYVNRGLGHLGYAGRVGIYPEITIITIQSNQT